MVKLFVWSICSFKFANLGSSNILTSLSFCFGDKSGSSKADCLICPAVSPETGAPISPCPNWYPVRPSAFEPFAAAPPTILPIVSSVASLKYFLYTSIKPFRKAPFDFELAKAS